MAEKECNMTGNGCENNNSEETLPRLEKLTIASGDGLDGRSMDNQISTVVTQNNSSCAKSISQPGTPKQPDQQEYDPLELRPLEELEVNEGKTMNEEATKRNEILQSLLYKPTFSIPIPDVKFEYKPQFVLISEDSPGQGKLVQRPIAQSQESFLKKVFNLSAFGINALLEDPGVNLDVVNECPSQGLPKIYVAWIQSADGLLDLHKELNEYNQFIHSDLDYRDSREYLLKQENRIVKMLTDLAEVYYNAYGKMIGDKSPVLPSETATDEIIEYLSQAAEPTVDRLCAKVVQSISEELSAEVADRKISELFRLARFNNMLLTTTAHIMEKWFTVGWLESDTEHLHSLQLYIEELYEEIENVRRSTARVLMNNSIKTLCLQFGFRNVTFLMALATVAASLYNFLSQKNDIIKKLRNDQSYSPPSML